VQTVVLTVFSFVVFVSLYRPGHQNPAGNLSPAQWLAAAEKADYHTLHLEQSNLKPIIKSIDSHASRLEHCWLVSTIASQGEQVGSIAYLPALTAYLIQEKGIRCSYHSGSQYAISLDDDVLVATKTRDLLEAIFAEADKLGVPDEEVVADFTGGPRSKTLGTILACLDERRTIQFAGTHYDEQGQAVGELFPIIFDFAPEIEES